MSAPGSAKRKKGPLANLPPKSKKAKQAAEYHSSSEDEAVELDSLKLHDLDIEYESGESESLNGEQYSLASRSGHANGTTREMSHANDDQSSEDEELDDEEDYYSEASSISGTSSTNSFKSRKRNDPTAFATSISKILSAKLTSQQRNDPVLSRSKAASANAAQLTESRLEVKARKKLRDDKRAAKERGRVKDVLGLQTPDADVGAIMEQEKKLRKVAQRGVVKLFNAVRAAQVKAEEAKTVAGGSGTGSGMVGIERRQERVTEMSKKGFLDFLASGGKT